MTDIAREMARTGVGRSRSGVRTSDYYALGGGLNLSDPNLQTDPGEVVGVNNYEPGLRGGYRRVDGFERVDGRQRPHKAEYSAADGTFQSPATPASQGDTLTGSTSGATATFIKYTDAKDEIAVANVSGTFVSGETLTNPSGQNEFTISETITKSGGSDDDVDRDFKYATQDYYRGLIQAVPGAGPVRGVWVHRDGIYAFRDDADPATESRMYKATTGGWSQVALGTKVRYWRGEKRIEEGDVLTGAVSGATCTVKRVAVFRGTFGASDALGFVITDSVTGTFTTGEELQVDGDRVADLYPDAGNEVQLFFTAAPSYYAINIVDDADDDFVEDDQPSRFEKITIHDSGSDAVVANGYYLGANKAPSFKPDQIAIVEWDGGSITNGDKIKNTDGDVFATVDGNTDPEKSGSKSAAMHGVWSDRAAGFYIDEDVGFDATEEIAIGDTLTGTDSGASLTVKEVVLTSGDWVDKTARGYVWASSVTGTFLDEEELKVGADVVGHSEEQDSQIHQLRFYKGAIIPEEGDTLTGATSAATFVVKDVILLRGAWKEGVAEGYITATPGNTSGTFTQNETITVGGETMGQVTPSDTTIISVTEQKLEAGGHYEFRNMNFGGHDDSRRMYGVNGQQPAFEYDDQDGVFVLIESGMGDDRPRHIGIHSGHLFLSFRGGSVQHSGYLEPYSFHPVTGADERTVGEDVMAIQEEKQALFVFTRNQTYVLYGDVRENFQMRPFAKETGCLEWTVQRLGTSFYVDDRGVTNLQAVDQYGNFAHSSISQKIEKLLRAQIINNNLQCSAISRQKNLYRIFFSDGSGIVMGVGREGITGFMSFDLGGKRPFCTCAEEFEGGAVFEERSLVGATDGFVYEMDKGDNFDGERIEAFLRTAPHYSSSPSRYKRYRKCQIDLQAEGKATLEVASEYNFGLAFGGKPREISALGGGGLWNVDSWDQFKWSSPAKSYVNFKMEGSGYNVTFLFHTSQKDEPAHTLYGIMLQWSTRRIDRGVSG